MRTTYDLNTVRDFGPRYKDTYGFLINRDNPTERRLVYITSNDDRAVYFITETDGLTYHALRDSGVQFEFIPVNRGFFNGTNNKVYHLQRVPARQWRRGLGRSNTEVSTVTAEGIFTTKLSFGLCHTMFDNAPDYRCQGEIPTNRAISKHFAICGDRLYFHQLIAGYMAKSGGIELTNKVSIQQELQDTLRRNGYDKLIYIKGVN